MRLLPVKNSCLILILATVLFHPLHADEMHEDQYGNDRHDFRIQIGLFTGFQINPMETRDLVRADVKAMTLAVNALNLSSSSQNLVKPAQVESISSELYAIPFGISFETMFFDFLRVRLMASYDLPIPRENAFYDLSSGDKILYTSEIQVRQIQVPLLFMLNVPMGINTLYMGAGPIFYYGWLTKTVTEKNYGTNVVKTDVDEYKGIALGIAYMIGIQRSIDERLSFSANLMFQSGARAGFVDTVQNQSSNNNPGSFGDLSGDAGSETYSDGSFNPGAPRILGFEGLRYIASVNRTFNF